MFYNIIYCLILLCIFICPKGIRGSLQGEEVSGWAETIGKELWTLGQTITRYSEIEHQYKFLNAKVQQKDPPALLEEIKANMSIMIDRKIRAIKNLQNKSEEIAESFEPIENFTYYSSKYSPIGDEIFKPIYPIFKKNKGMYRNMTVNNDTHFYNIAVNTNYSSVHVPLYIYDKDPNVSFAIQWSEALDKIFVENYKIDPALSWQYFGSMTGIMRHYPAQKWTDLTKELLLFDCRIRTWFIEAATCTKDIVILIDTSGSMRGMPLHIGSLTAFAILDTLSNNDYVNILNYTLYTNYTVPCFSNMLAQATEENIQVFKRAVEKLQPEGKTQVSQALEVAFKLLAKYREKRKCSDENSNCNQAIMIITDGMNEDITEIVQKYNNLHNGTNIPVRIFGYLVGKEVTNPQEMKDTCCTNRGYYTPVTSLEQVSVSVVQYVNVIARPLVLQGEDHPVSWTHAYADVTYDSKLDQTVIEPYRLLTSVAIPCYDMRINKMNDTRTAYLLGVVATDVPIDEFERITVPYKIGVNGYAFIVSNNGYILMHPDLRPMYAGVTKFNYNSIDITQVEHHVNDDDDDITMPRQITESASKLRKSMVDGETGSIHNVTLRYHYDNMKRVFEAKYDYYFTPIEKTPFTMGLAIPHGYGMYTLEVGDEIMKNKHTGQNLTSFFTGNKWRINPKWVYCKYHYLEGHEFDTPEKELLHFLAKMYGNFRWESQYEDKVELLKEEDYYCDMHLVQKLIFDGRVTLEIFSQKWKFQPRELPLFQRFNASLRFVATMSGLIRWDYIFGDPTETNTKGSNKEFGDQHLFAINEQWYKNAVLQHQYDESFVYSVPFDAGQKDNQLVTGSFAIFPKDGGHEAPGSVVGYQFSQQNLQTRFKEISNKLSNQCSHCSRCNDSLDCYIVDSSGYIIVSEDSRDTGLFFGQIEGDIMDSMLKIGLFKQATMFDYQAFCKKDNHSSSCASRIITKPFGYIQAAVEWIAWKMYYSIMEISFVNFKEMFVFAQEEYPDYPVENDTADDSYEEPEFDNSQDQFFACETELNLFILQQDLFIKKSFHGEIANEGGRNYYVKRIMNSNLILIAINNSLPKGYEKYTTEPIRITEEENFEAEFINTTLLPCQKLYLNNMHRRRLTGCYNDHPLEHEIVDCGRGTLAKITTGFLILPIIVWIME